MKSSTYLQLMAMMFSGMMMDSTNNSSYHELTEWEIEELNRAREKHYNKLLLKRGCKEFNIDGFKVIALNEKNAKRKYTHALSKNTQSNE